MDCSGKSSSFTPNKETIALNSSVWRPEPSDSQGQGCYTTRPVHFCRQGDTSVQEISPNSLSLAKEGSLSLGVL